MIDPVNMLVYAATEAEFLNPDVTRDSLRKIREAGFDAIYLEFRNVRAPRQGARFRAGMEAIVTAAKEAGLFVALEASFNNLDSELLEEAPGVFTDTLQMQTLRVEGGLLRFEAGGDPSIWTFVGAVRPRPDGDEILVLPGPRIVIEGGGCAMTAHPGRSRAVFVWDLAVPDGPVLLFTRRKFEYSFKDLSHPELHRRLASVVMSRLACKPGELFWDEPHFGFAFYDNNGRAISDHLLETFANRFGYRLEDRLPDLWIDRPGAVKVRIDYSELLESALAGLEKTFVDAVREVTSTVRLGGHRTMHEELSDDTLIGCADYFRHDAATTASYSDSVYEREDSMITMAHLARSMAMGTPGRPAWNMSWGFRPTPAMQERYLRLLGAMNVRWCGHAWNDTMMFGPGYPHHPCWDSLPAALANHRSWIEVLNGAEPLADTWVVYNWRAPLREVGPHRHTHRRSFLFLGRQLTLCGASVRIVNGEALPSHETPLPKRLIVPWPDLLPRTTWQRIRELADGGVEVLMFGPPARCDNEGLPLAEEWMAFAGSGPTGPLQPLFAGDSIEVDGRPFVLDPDAIQPGWDDAPAVTLPSGLPVERVGGAQPVGFLRGEPVIERSGRTIRASVEVPMFPGLLEHLLGLTPPRGFLSFPYRQDGREIETRIAWEHPLPSPPASVLWQSQDGSGILLAKPFE